MLPKWYEPPHIRKPKRHPANNFLIATAREFDFTASQLKSKSKPAPLAFARHVAWYAIRKNRPDLSLPTIARITGFKDHTSVIYGVRRIKGLLETDPSLRVTIDRIEYNARTAPWEAA